MVQVLPNECWQVTPLVYEDESVDNITPFEAAWDELGKNLRGGTSSYKDEEGSIIWEYLKRIDRLSRVGHFGVLLVGIDDAKNLDQPVDGVSTTDPMSSGWTFSGTPGADIPGMMQTGGYPQSLPDSASGYAFGGTMDETRGSPRPGVRGGSPGNNQRVSNAWTDEARAAALEARQAAGKAKVLAKNSDPVLVRASNKAFKLTGLAHKASEENADNRLSHEQAAQLHRNAYQAHRDAASSHSNRSPWGSHDVSHAHELAADKHKEAASRHLDKAMTFNQRKFKRTFAANFAALHRRQQIFASNMAHVPTVDLKLDGKTTRQGPAYYDLTVNAWSVPAVFPILNDKGQPDKEAMQDEQQQIGQAQSELQQSGQTGPPPRDPGAMFGGDNRPINDPTSAMDPHDPAGLASGAVGTDAQYVGIQLGPSEYPSKEPSKATPRLLFLRPFDESLVQIVQYEANVRNPRFGQPVMYRITLNDPREMHSGIGLPMATVRVHWSRVVHIADNLGSSEIFGVPAMRPVLNRLLDLRKVYGADAEGFWRCSFPGLAFSTHPQLGGDVITDDDAIRDTVENYYNSLQKYLIGKGMDVKTISGQIADPTAHIMVQIEAICIQIGVPKRVFMGSERGELASSQDDAAWNDRLRERQNNYITPRVICPFIDRMIAMGVLPQPTQYSITWPDLDSLNDKDKAAIALQQVQAIAAYIQAGADSLVPPRDFLTRIMDMDEEEVESILEESQLYQEQQLDHGMQPGTHGEPLPQPAPVDAFGNPLTDGAGNPLPAAPPPGVFDDGAGGYVNAAGAAVTQDETGNWTDEFGNPVVDTQPMEGGADEQGQQGEEVGEVPDWADEESQGQQEVQRGGGELGDGAGQGPGDADGQPEAVGGGPAEGARAGDVPGAAPGDAGGAGEDGQGGIPAEGAGAEAAGPGDGAGAQGAAGQDSASGGGAAGDVQQTGLEGVNPDEGQPPADDGSGGEAPPPQGGPDAGGPGPVPPGTPSAADASGAPPIVPGKRFPPQKKAPEEVSDEGQADDAGSSIPDAGQTQDQDVAGDESPPPAEMSDEEVQAEADQLMAEMAQEFADIEGVDSGEPLEEGEEALPEELPPEEETANAFCPTGPGGKQDPSCGQGGGQAAGPAAKPGASDTGGKTNPEADAKANKVLAFAKRMPAAVYGKIKTTIANKYATLEKRYGPKYAKAIIGAGLIGTPIPIPGSTFAAMAPVIGVAELHRFASRRWGAGAAALKTSPVAHAYLAFADFLDPETVNAFCPGEGVKDNSCPPGGGGSAEEQAQRMMDKHGSAPNLRGDEHEDHAKNALKGKRAELVRSAIADKVKETHESSKGFTQANLEQLHAAAKEKLPSLTVPQFHAALSDMQQKGEIRLEPHTYGIKTLKRPELAMPLHQEWKWYAAMPVHNQDEGPTSDLAGGPVVEGDEGEQSGEAVVTPKRKKPKE